MLIHIYIFIKKLFLLRISLKNLQYFISVYHSYHTTLNTMQRSMYIKNVRKSFFIFYIFHFSMFNFFYFSYVQFPQPSQIACQNTDQLVLFPLTCFSGIVQAYHANLHVPTDDAAFIVLIAVGFILASIFLSSSSGLPSKRIETR